MRILSLHSSYLSGPVSGENRVVKDEAKLLRSAGHKVEVWSPEPKASGVLPLVNTAIGMVWSRSAARYTRELIREFSPDVVHCHNLFPALSPAVINAANDFPVVMTLHNYRLACLPGTLFRDGQICELCLGGGIASGIRYACYRSSHTASATLGTSLMLHRKLGTFEKVSIFVAISEFLKSTMQRGGIARDRMIVKPHFAWPTPRRDGPGDYFLFMGRLVPEKGIEFLADL